MALKLKYTDEHGILHINMSPSTTPSIDGNRNESATETKTDISDPKFDTINSRFGQYDLFGAKYDVPSESGGEDLKRSSLFRSRYNSIEEELANTPYAFTTERSLHLNSLNNNVLDITIKRDDISPSKDIEDDRFFNRNLNLEYDLFGPEIEFQTAKEPPAFTVTQLIHAQDRYFDLSSRQSSNLTEKSARVKSDVRSAPNSAKEKTVKILDSKVSSDVTDAFTVLAAGKEKAVHEVERSAVQPAIPTSKRKRETSFAILPPPVSRPSSPKSLPLETRSDARSGRVSPFRGRGFREETSRHNTPKSSAANSRACSPTRRRTSSLSRIDKMADTACLPPPVHSLLLTRPHSPPSPRDFVKENIEEIRELSELNREMHEAEAEKLRLEEEEALLKEMGLLDKNAKLNSLAGSKNNSRNASRCSSPSKIKIRSRSNSPSTILHFEIIPARSKENINGDDGMAKPVLHKSRMRSVSRSQPQSNNGSPKHSKIPKRQNSVSPTRTVNKWEASKKTLENNLQRNQRFISNSTSSINETIKIGSSVHDKRAISKSQQHLSISPAVIKGKPPISPGRGGPPPSNRAINPKRLSPIVGTPNKSPVDGSKPGSAKTPMKPAPPFKKPMKTAGNTPATSRLTSRQPSRSVSRDPSSEKRRPTSKAPVPKPANKLIVKPVSRTPSTRTTQKSTVMKSDVQTPINRTPSLKSLVRTPSTKTLNEKPPILKKKDSKKDLRDIASSVNTVNKHGIKKEDKPEAKKPAEVKPKETEVKFSSTESSTDEIIKQDIHTQVDNTITNEKGELVILTKKNIISMTTAAITAQPLEIVTTVTNQLPTTLEKAREKGIFERHSSKDSIAAKDLLKEEDVKPETKNNDTENKTATDDKSNEEKKVTKVIKETPKPIFDDSVKLKPLQPPYNNPQVERAKQRIDDILKSPEVSSQNILAAAAAEASTSKSKFKNLADKAKTDIKDSKNDIANKIMALKEEAIKQQAKTEQDIRTEATKIVDSIITPVEEPKETIPQAKEVTKIIEPIITVVNEKINGPSKEFVKTTERLVKGDPEVEVQSSNVSTPIDKMAEKIKMADAASDISTQGNGGFPQSTSTTPKPPVRTRSAQSKAEAKPDPGPETAPELMKQSLCARLVGKCVNRSPCACCRKKEDEQETAKKVKNSMKSKVVEKTEEGKKGILSKLNCCKKKQDVEERIGDLERRAGKVSIDFENETRTKRKRKFRDVLCACCAATRRVSDVTDTHLEDTRSGCCGRRPRGTVERRDSILSDRPTNSCCNNRLFTWLRGACRRKSDTASRRNSLFSKNKSLSPTLPSEDTRPKLDASLIEHTSSMRGAIPILPPVLAYLCLVCNVIVPGLGTIFSGMFCLCFGIPRFGPHDGAKYRIGSFVLNLFVGVGQLFTVLFCLVGWGWSIWWGVIMIRISRKYRRLKAEALAAEAEEAQVPPVTTNNHARV